MNTQPQKPLQGKELSELYPKAKTYDEKIAEREAATAMRRARQQQHPVLMSLLYISALAASMYGIVIWLMPLAMVSPIVIVPIIFLGMTAWAYALLWTIRKIRDYSDQLRN